jgi:hypothetical protein
MSNAAPETGAPEIIKQLFSIKERLTLLEALLKPGTFALFPFRATALPFGYYYANGDRYAVDSEQGEVLVSLDANFKTDWAITVSSNTINVPKLFSSDSRGYFFRAGATPGIEQTDAIRNIKSVNKYFYAEFKKNAFADGSYASPDGPFYTVDTPFPSNAFSGKSASNFDLVCPGIDVSKSVPTAAENRPINKSLVPAIYLGV